MINDVIFNHNTTDPISMFDDWDLVLTKIENPNEIQKILEENNGNIREAISNLNEEGIKKCK